MQTVAVKFNRGDNDVTLGVLAAQEKVFSTGSVGFFGSGKITIGEKRYQCQVQMVEIGSRPKPAGYIGPEETPVQYAANNQAIGDE
jgi:hypothetical protein